LFCNVPYRELVLFGDNGHPGLDSMNACFIQFEGDVHFVLSGEDNTRCLLPVPQSHIMKLDFGGEELVLSYRFRVVVVAGPPLIVLPGLWFAFQLRGGPFPLCLSELTSHREWVGHLSGVLDPHALRLSEFLYCLNSVFPSVAALLVTPEGSHVRY